MKETHKKTWKVRDMIYNSISLEMKPCDIKNFKRNRAAELARLYEILRDKFHFNSSDITPIKTASEQIMKAQDNGLATWGYSISNLIFPIATTRHIIPKGLIVRVKINCDLQGNILNWIHNNDVYSYICRFSFTIYGDLNGEKYSICWHIDCDKDSKSDEYHPLYHLHYSDGTEHLGQKNIDFQWGNAIYLDCPRITHYPLDLILGIGFYYTNFQYKGLFDKLIADPLFGKLYRQSQDAILKPYFYNLAAHWNDDLRKTLIWKSSSDLCPILIN